MNRRQFLQASAAAVLVAGTRTFAAAPPDRPVPTPAKLPRWRGFNLLEKFTAPRHKPFLEEDFALIAELGFDFVRLPLSYQCWADTADWLNLKEPVLKEIDQAVEFGKRYGIHVNINFHRAPGYCVNPPAEPLDLFKDEKALEASAFHWAHFAQRYKGRPSSEVSFDLLNEPARLPEDQYVRVVRRLVEAIRSVDPQRLIIADGLQWGNVPVKGLVDLKIAQSTRGYTPSQISHYQASWMSGSDKWPVPTWPLKGRDAWDKDRLKRERIEPFQALEKQGVGVHVGEWGAYNRTPHDVVLAWMADCLDLWREAGWGWSMWNFRGSFGILDSGRKDIQYEPWKGHQLDRKMLELLKR